MKLLVLFAVTVCIQSAASAIEPAHALATIDRKLRGGGGGGGGGRGYYNNDNYDSCHQEAGYQVAGCQEEGGGSGNEQGYTVALVVLLVGGCCACSCWIWCRLQDRHEMAAQKCLSQGHSRRSTNRVEMLENDNTYRNSWKCDLCNSEYTEEAFTHCDQCNLDFCQNCNEILTEEGEAEVLVKCPDGHPLAAFATPEAGYKCDKCSQSLPKGVTLYGCRLCNYDVCKTCAPKEGMQTPSVPPRLLGSGALAPDQNSNKTSEEDDVVVVAEGVVVAGNVGGDAQGSQDAQVLSSGPNL